MNHESVETVAAGIIEKSKETEVANGDEGEKEITLLEIKRKVRTERETQKDDNRPRKYRIINYTSRDSLAEKAEKEFTVYYCYICAYNTLISEVNINQLPHRKTDNSVMFPLKKIIHKKFIKTQSNKIMIKRKDGVEVQYRILCKKCKAPVGYTSSIKDDVSVIYFYDYALLKDQMACKIFQDI